jgi:Trk K+ transport system NAD-binding subunit
VSELAIIFVIIGAQSFHLSPQLISAISVAMFASMCISAFQVSHRQRLYHALQPLLRLTERGHHRHTAMITGSLPEETMEGHTVFFGYHKMGYHILQQALNHKEKVLVVDFNPDVISRLRDSGIHAIYGDIEDEQIFFATNLAKAALVVSTVPHKEETTFLLKMAHKLNPKLPVIVTARTIEDALSYYHLHAAYVLLPHLLGSEHIAEVIKHHRKGTITDFASKRTEELKLLQTAQDSLFAD